MCRKIVEYFLLTAASMHELVSAVREELKNGYEPFGGVTFIGFVKERPNESSVCFGLSAVVRNLEVIDQPYVQTMVKYENISNEDDGTTQEETDFHRKTHLAGAINDFADLDTLKEEDEDNSTCPHCGYDGPMAIEGFTEKYIKFKCPGCDSEFKYVRGGNYARD